MFDAIKPLLDSGLINEDVSRELNEAWQSKLNEAREQVRVELREEFAQRYEHDKSVMVEALDKMVTEGLQTELTQVAAEKQALAEDRVKFQARMKESAQKFNGFLVTKLAEEIGELRRDRKQHSGALKKLEGFVVEALAREIREFAQDKKDLVATKVHLVREAREKLQNLKARFVKESASKMSQAVSRHLKAELSQLHEDIQIARENNFGRRIFEAYATEFGATHLNEKAEIRKMQAQLVHKNQRLAEAVELAEKAQVLIENKERELRMIRETNQRQDLMQELLRPLNREKAEVMRNLLESVQTTRLKSAFEKYLPAVLEDRSVKALKVIAESVSAVTGDKTVPTPVVEEDRSNVITLKRLAGLCL
jgi:hypothetical protein